MEKITEKPSALIVKPDQIPAAIELMKAWVVWRYEWNLNWTKVPYQTDGFMKASSTDSSTWGTFRDAIDRYQQGGFDGIGFVLDPQNNVIGVDLDHCVADSTTAVWAMKIMFQLDSYTELSPSGTGLRILLYGKIPATGRKKNAIEIYDRARYLTITGHHRAGTPVRLESRQAAIDGLHSRLFSPEPQRSHQTPRYKWVKLADSELLEKAFHARNGDKVQALYGGDISGYRSASEADLALCRLLRVYTNDTVQLDRLFRSSSLFREKWDNRHYADGRTYGEGTISKAMGQ